MTTIVVVRRQRINLGGSWTWVVNFTPWSLYPGKGLDCQFNRRLGGPQGQSGRFWRKETCLALIWIWTPDRQARGIVLIPTVCHHAYFSGNGRRGMWKWRWAGIRSKSRNTSSSTTREETVEWDTSVGVTVMMLSQTSVGGLLLKSDGTRAETRFRLSAKRTSQFKSVGGVSSIYYWQPRCAHQR